MTNKIVIRIDFNNVFAVFFDVFMPKKLPTAYTGKLTFLMRNLNSYANYKIFIIHVKTFPS